MKRLSKRIRIFLIIVGSLVVLVVGVRFGLDALLTAKLARMASDMGLSWPPRVTPSPIADSENAATVYRKAWNLIEEVPSDPDWQDSEEAKREAAAADCLFEKLKADEYDNLLDDIEVLRPFLARQEEGLKLLVEAASRDKCDFNVDYSQGLEKTDLSHLANSRRAARVLGFAAIVAAADGDADAAAKYSSAIFTIGNHLAHESNTISQLVRCAVFNIGYGYLRDVSSLCGIPPEWRARLSKEFSRYEDWDTWLDMTYERIMTLRTMEMLANGETTLLDRETLLALPARQLFGALAYWLLFESRLLGPPVVKMNAIRYLELSAQLDESYRDPSYVLSVKCFPDELSGLVVEVVNADGVAEGVDADTVEEALLRPADSEDGSLLYSLGIEFLMRGALARARLRMWEVRAKAMVTRVGFALSACREETGSYPDALGVLAPDFIDQIPLDPYSDEPLLYRRENEGFVVYSVGPDGEDDGGVYEPKQEEFWLEKDDIAWRASR